MPAADEQSPYAFGDGERAAERLELLARVFNSTTADFLRSAARRPCALAVDLGCGPGHTTALIAEVVEPTRAIGLERSPDFARRAADEMQGHLGRTEVAFVTHDVTILPLPSGPADLVFARYLLAHLPAAEDQVAAWATALRPGGRLLLEEVEQIDTEQTPFATYLDAAAEMLRGNGTELYVGARLDRMAPPTGTRRVVSRSATIAPPTALVARMFRLNLSVWRRDANVRARHPAGALDDLAADLASLERSTARGEIVWTHRQLAFER